MCAFLLKPLDLFELIFLYSIRGIYFIQMWVYRFSSTLVGFASWFFVPLTKTYMCLGRENLQFKIIIIIILL